MPKQALTHISSSNKKRMGLVTVLLLLVSLVTTQAEATDSLPGPSRSQVTHIVTISGSSSSSLVAAEHGLGHVARFSRIFTGFAANIPEGRLSALSRDPRVKSIEPNIWLHVQADPGVPIGLSSQTVPTGVRRIGADLNTVAPIDGVDDRVPVIVALLDTGVDGDHPDLNVNVARSVDCSDGLSCIPGIASDDNGHGTHVAGTIAALDNTIGVVGVAPGAEIWSIKVCGGSGSCSLSAILLGHEYISANAGSIGVTNISLGGQGWSESWRSAIATNVNDGVVVVVAAGNSSRDIYGNDGSLGNGNESIPAAYSEAMTVSGLLDIDGATGGAGGSHVYGVDDSLGDFTNFGAAIVAGNPVTSPGASIDIAAPSVDVLSTAPDGAYVTMSGTSTAAPHVVGVAALHIAAIGRASNAAEVNGIRQSMIDDGVPMTDWRSDDFDIGSDLDPNHEPLVSGVVSAPIPPPVIEYDAAVIAVNAPVSVIGGSSAIIAASVANFGTESASIAVEFIDETSGLLIDSAGVDLAAGASTDLSAVWDTTGVANGGHEIRVTATVIDDINAANDSLSTITVVEQAVLDLTTAISVSPDVVFAGDQTTVTVSMVNEGNVEYLADVPVSVTSDHGTPADPADDFVVFSTALPGPIPPGGSSVITNAIATTTYSAALHTLTAQLVISDSNAVNNSARTTLLVQAVPAAIVATVSTDRGSYSNRDFAYITVAVRLDTGVPVAGASVVVKIEKPKGRPNVHEGLTGTDGTYVKKLRVSAKKGGCGTYTVTANVSSSGLTDTAVQTFLVCR